MDSGYPSSGRALNTPGDSPELRNLVVQCHNALNRSTRRRPCELTGASLGRSVCRAISVARARAALTAAIPRSSRALVRPTSFGAAKSCSLVIIFMIRPPTAQSSDSNNAHRSRPHHGSPAFHWGVQFQAGMSPTCTAVQAPPRAVDVGKSSGSVGGCRASRADQVLLPITPSFSAPGAACRAARAELHSALAAYNVRHAHLSSMLVRKDPESAPLCPQCGDAMRLARKLPPVRPLSGLVVHLYGGCGYVGTAEREPDPPPPKWLRPTRGVRYSAGTRERQ